MTLNISRKNKKTVLIFLTCVLALLAALALYVSLNKHIDPDEFEHIHSAWYVKNGYVPYRDFYQCHNPLFWYMMAPFIYLLGESIGTVIKLRVMIFMFTMGIAFFTYLTAKKATGSKETGLLSAALLLSTVIFVSKGIEIRPDVPQVFFGLVALYFLLDFFQSDKDRSMAYSGIAAALSFLFLQKAAVRIVGFFLIFLYKAFNGKLRWRPVIFFAVSFFMPLAGFLVYLLASGSYNDYYMANWIRHLFGKPGFPAFHTIKSTFFENPAFWLLSDISFCFIFLNRETVDDIRIIAFLGASSFISLLLVLSPYEQYLLPAIPLLSISTGYFIFLVFERFKLKDIYRIMVLGLIIILPLDDLINMGKEDNRDLFARAEFVIENSGPSDLVYDGGAEVNLFRGDLHYFWYSVGEGAALDDYKRLTGKYGGYNVCRLIEEKKPKFVLARFGFPEEGCPDMALSYNETEYRDLYIRK